VGGHVGAPHGNVACAACGRRYVLAGGPLPTIVELTPDGAETAGAQAR
jgi:hypothetical protein